MIETATPIVKLTGQYRTDMDGISRLLQLYQEAHSYQNTDITLDCTGLTHLDANLVSLLSALDYRLLQERNVQLKTDFPFLKEKFPILFQNGFLIEDGLNETDQLGRPLQLTKIDINIEEEFTNFLSNQLMCHKALAPIDERLKKMVNSEIIEIYTNIKKHAQTNSPFFACGHHFMTDRVFKITLVDLGVGFLPPIRKFTHEKPGQRFITTDGEAIQWAMEDTNSSTGEQFSGEGLKGILQFCAANGGKLQVASGNDFWSTDISTSEGRQYESMSTAFSGSIINLWVKCG